MKVFLRRLFRFLITIILLAGIVEFTTRSFVLMGEYPSMAEFRLRESLIIESKTANGEVIRRFPENYTGRLLGRKFETDSYGFRKNFGTSPSELKSDSAYIAVLGNSTVAGLGVSENVSLVGGLADNFNMTVANFGVPNTSFDIAINNFRAHLSHANASDSKNLIANPKLVLLVLSVADFPYQAKPRRSFFRWSYFAELMQIWFNPLLVHFSETPTRGELIRKSVVSEKAWRKFEEAFVKLANEMRVKNVPVLAVILPDLMEWKLESLRPLYVQVGNLLRSRNITTFNFWEDYPSRLGREWWLAENYPKPNDRAHAAFAGEITAFIKSHIEFEKSSAEAGAEEDAKNKED